MTEPNAQAADQQQEPPWGADFDAEKAWNLVKNLRDDKEKLAARPVLTDEQKTQLAEYEKAKKASQTELERVQGEATRWQTETETWRNAAVLSTIEALAVDFEYPEDAVNALREKNYLDAGGTIDKRSIKADLAKLIEQRPNWKRAEPEGTRAPRPNPAQGSSGGHAAPNPAQEFASILQGGLAKQ